MEFQNRPPQTLAFRCLDLVRTPARGGLRGIITCDRSIGTFTHYFGGKTVPCGGSLCQACDDHCAKRWHSYLSLLLPSPEKHVICEITLAAAEEVWAFEDKNPSLREAHITLARRGDRDNGRVSASFSWAMRGKLQLPPAPAIEQNLRVMWGLDLREHLGNHTPADAQATEGATREIRVNGTRARRPD